MKNVIRSILIQCGFNDIVVLSSGVILSQLIGILTQPMATRLYLPMDFGVFAIISSIISIVSPALTLQYDLCIVIAKTDREANAITALSFYLGIVMAILISGAVIIYSSVSQDFRIAGNWIYIVIPMLFMTAITNVVTSYNNRLGQYKLMATVSLFRAVASNIVKIGLGLLQVGFPGLIIAMMVSIVAGIQKQSELIILNKKSIFSTNITEIKEVLLKYKNQPLVSLPGFLLIAYSYSILPFMINSMYGIIEVGYYSLSIAMLGLPVTLISSNVGRVFLRNASLERNEKGNFYNSLKSTSILLFLSSIIPFGGLWFFAEPLFSTVFGPEWVRSGTYVKLLIPWYYLNFIVGSLVVGLVITGKQKIKLIIQVAFVIESFVIYFLANQMFWDMESFISAISNAYMVTYLVLYIVIYKESKSNAS